MKVKEKPLMGVKEVLSNLLNKIIHYSIKYIGHIFYVVDINHLPDSAYKDFKTLLKFYKKTNKIEVKGNVACIGDTQILFRVLFKAFRILDNLFNLDFDSVTYYYYSKELPVIVYAEEYEYAVIITPLVEHEKK